MRWRGEVRQIKKGKNYLIAKKTHKKRKMEKEIRKRKRRLTLNGFLSAQEMLTKNEE